MLCKAFVTIAIVLISLCAFSAESEFFYQSKVGQSDLTPQIGYLLLTQEDNSSYETNASGLAATGVSYEYGLNKIISFEVVVLYSSYEVKSENTKVSGLHDPRIGLKGTSNIGISNLRYGVYVDIPLENRNNKSNGDVNMATGGISATPYLGIDTEFGGGSTGLKLSYKIQGERTIEREGDTDLKQTSGNSLGIDAFYETMITDVILGGAINYLSQDSSKIDSIHFTFNSYDTFGVSLYSRIPFGTWSLIPRLEYVFSNSLDYINSYNQLVLSAAARFTF